MAVKQKTKPKETALKAIEHLKDSASNEDKIYELYVHLKVEHGQEDVRKSLAVNHIDLKKRFGKWLK